VFVHRSHALPSLIVTMAGKKKNAAASAAPEPVPEVDGPVLIVLKKRLRAANKKLRKIEDVEAAVESGKEINEEQRALLTGKPGLQAVIDELEKLSTLLCQALGDEATVHQQHGYEKAMAEVKQQEAERHAKEAMEAAAAEAAKAADKVAEAEEKHDKATVTEPKEPEKPDHTPVVEKLLQLLYFAQVGQRCCWELQKQYSAAI
jgi:septal ring factor EnvC (AmiA/AmiB activator)